MEVSAVRTAVLRDRNFSSTESSGSKGPLWSPARTIKRSQEDTRGDLEAFILLAPFRNLTMRSCFPRDRPSTASWWAASCPGATHGGSIDLDADAIWCRAHERGYPSSEECAREVLSRRKLVRETRSGWFNGAQQAGPAPRPPWACTVSVRVGSLRETHTCVRPKASCVPVRLCRGGPRSGKSTAGSGRTRGKQTGSPEFPRIDSRSAGSSRDGVATLRGIRAVVRARRLHDWASPGCEQRAVTWTAWDSRGGDGGWAVTCGVIVYLPAGWCTRQPQCCPCGLTRSECSQCWSGLQWSNPSSVTAAADAICPRSLWNCFSGTTFLPLKEIWQFSTTWARSSVRACRHTHRV